MGLGTKTSTSFASCVKDSEIAATKFKAAIDLLKDSPSAE
jgi:hypothetical protein